MIRSLMIGMLLATSAAPAVQAQTGGPPIAYVKRLSNGDEIHLVAPDGVERLRIYKARSKIQITMLDLRPGGGEVAFTENHKTLKILAFDDFGGPMPGNPREIRSVSSPCSVESPDYHPEDGSLIYVEGCGRDRGVWRIQSGGNVPDATPLFSSLPVFRVRWSRLADLVYYVGLRDGASSSDPTYLYRRSMADGTTDELGVLNSWHSFDVARQGEKLFWGGNGEPFSLLDFAAGATTADAQVLACPAGSRMSRSPDDSMAVHQSPWARGKGNYVMLSSIDCENFTSEPLTGQGSWGWIDWRN